jgi:hypothetical protein
MHLDQITIQNNLNRSIALREQYKNSELYTDHERIKRIESLDRDIQKYERMLEKITNCPVRNPQILS